LPPSYLNLKDEGTLARKTKSRTYSSLPSFHPPAPLFRLFLLSILSSSLEEWFVITFAENLKLNTLQRNDLFESQGRKALITKL
jgi:hypothetical protein